MNEVGSIKEAQPTLKKDGCLADGSMMMPETAGRHAETYFPSVLKPILLMALAVFAIEFVLEYSLAHFFKLSLPRHVLVDSAATVVFFSPIFYFVLYRPFERLDAERRRVQFENQLLSRKLIRRSEDEKQRLARDLHDNFGQVLTALQFGVATLKGSCQTSESLSQGCAHQVDYLSHMIATLGDQVRSMTLDLRPPALEALGLAPAIETLIEGDWGELEISFEELGISRRCAPEIELAIFRICQEALNNILKHARATRAEICLSFEETNLRLKVSDNGIGFDPAELNTNRDRRRGFGLLGLRERVASFNGELYLESKPGGGTTIQLQVPTELQRRRDEADQDSDC